MGTSLRRVLAACRAAVSGPSEGGLILYDAGSAWLTIGSRARRARRGGETDASCQPRPTRRGDPGGRRAWCRRGGLREMAEAAEEALRMTSSRIGSIRRRWHCRVTARAASVRQEGGRKRPTTDDGPGDRRGSADHRWASEGCITLVTRGDETHEQLPGRDDRHRNPHHPGRRRRRRRPPGAIEGAERRLDRDHLRVGDSRSRSRSTWWRASAGRT